MYLGIGTRFNPYCGLCYLHCPAMDQIVVESTRINFYFGSKIKVNVTEAKVGINGINFTSICIVPSYDGA